MDQAYGMGRVLASSKGHPPGKRKVTPGEMTDVCHLTHPPPIVLHPTQGLLLLLLLLLPPCLSPLGAGPGEATRTQRLSRQQAGSSTVFPEAPGLEGNQRGQTRGSRCAGTAFFLPFLLWCCRCLRTAERAARKGALKRTPYWYGGSAGTSVPERLAPDAASIQPAVPWSE